MSKYELHCGDCLEVMREQIADASIDLTVTSPPYDNLRTYNGYTFDFEGIARELYRVTKPGGVVVWVVGDATINGSETGTSFRQALHFMECGFNLYDTMFWEKLSRIPTEGRYYSVIEYMFILSRGTPRATNFIADHRNATRGARKRKDAVINKGANVKRDDFLVTPEYSHRFDLREYPTGQHDDFSNGHVAIFPEALARDHILSWSNPGDMVFDPFMGSGTTGKMSMLLDRDFIGVEISSEYIDEIAEPRIADAARIARKEFKPMAGGMDMAELPLFAGA